MKYSLIKRNKATDAGNNVEFVRWMRKNDVQHFQENSEFMEIYSHRKSTFEKIDLRHDNEDNFVEDLQKNGLLKIEESKKVWNIFKRERKKVE